MIANIPEIIKKPLVIFVIAVVISFFLFGNTINGKFVLDDHSVIEKRESLKSFDIGKIFLEPWHPGAPWAGNYRPLSLISFSLNSLISDDPVGFHVINIVLYALNVALIFYLVRKIASEKVALVTAVLFLFLPIHVEPVASIVGRKELLGMFFGLLTIHYFLSQRFMLSSLTLLLSVLSNEASVALLPLIGVFLIIQKENFKTYLNRAIYYLPPVAIYFILRYLALGQYAFGGGSIDPVIGPLAYAPVSERIFTAFAHLFLYLKKTVYPIDLSPDYSFNQVPLVHNLFSSLQSMVGLVFLVGLVVFFFYAKRELKMAIALFLIPYFLISNIFLIATGTMAERWWLFPSFGLVFMISIGLVKFMENIQGRWLRMGSVFFGLGILVWYSFLITKQNEVWASDKSLFIYAAKASPQSVWARTNLASVYFEERKFELALQESKTALQIYDKYPATLNILGKVYWRSGRYTDSEDAFKKAAEFDNHGRNKRAIYRTLALLNLDQGKNSQAFFYMDEAVKWPAAREQKNILEVDNFLFEKMSVYKNRSPNSYTQSEKEGLTRLIKLLRGF